MKWTSVFFAMMLGAVGACGAEPMSSLAADSSAARFDALGVESVCDDGDDDDADGLFDCADPDCLETTVCHGAFSCRSGFFQAAATDLWQLDASSSSFSKIKLGTLPTSVSLGFNVLDGYAYGVEKSGKFRVVRILDDASFVPLGPEVDRSLNIATMDFDNNLWVTHIRQKKLIRINVVTLEKESFDVDVAPESSDLAFTPDDGNGRPALYGVSNDGTLTVVTLGPKPVVQIDPTVMIDGCQAFGAQMFARDGLLYAFCNDDGRIFAVDVKRKRATFVGGGGQPATDNDGFGCFLADSGFETCNNGLDDDGDGVVDENQPGNTCVSTGDPQNPPDDDDDDDTPNPPSQEVDLPNPLVLSGGPSSCTTGGGFAPLGALLSLLVRWLRRRR